MQSNDLIYWNHAFEYSCLSYATTLRRAHGEDQLKCFNIWNEGLSKNYNMHLSTYFPAVMVLHELQWCHVEHRVGRLCTFGLLKDGIVLFGHYCGFFCLLWFWFKRDALCSQWKCGLEIWSGIHMNQKDCQLKTSSLSFMCPWGFSPQLLSPYKSVLLAKNIGSPFSWPPLMHFHPSSLPLKKCSALHKTC